MDETQLKPMTAGEKYAEEIRKKAEKSALEQEERNRLAKEAKKKFNPLMGQSSGVGNKQKVVRRNGDGPAYLADIGKSPEAAVDGLRKNAGGVFENTGVRPHEARRHRKTDYVRPS